MAAKEHHRKQVIGLLSASILKTGLAKTSLRQLADAAGVSDRMLLYYFKDKSDILTSVLTQIAADMAVILAAAIPEVPALCPAQLIARAIAATQTQNMLPFMQLWIEIVAAAARNEQPYDNISRQIAEAFTMWIETRLDINHDETKHSVAAMILVIIDGLALFNICAGDKQTKLAIRAIQNLSLAPSPTA